MMKTIRILYHTLFYSSSNFSIALQNRKIDSNVFDIMYKQSVCGSLFIKDKQIVLSYSRGLHLLKGLIDQQNLEIKYNNGVLELYTKSPHKRILKAKCDEDVYKRIMTKMKNI